MTLEQRPSGEADTMGVAQSTGQACASATARMPTDGENIVIPLHVEDAIIEKRQQQTGVVRVSIATVSHERQIDEALAQERIVVERVPVGRVVAYVPPVRQEGDTTIHSVVEEVLVLERRLVLKEEVRIKRVRTTETHRETVQLREQFATVTRNAAGPAHTSTLKATAS